MTNAEGFTVLDGGPSAEDRQERLRDEATALGGGRRVVERPQFMLVVAGALITLGLAVIVIGWVGAANTTLLEEQVPYLISGGLLGLAITTVGALTFFSHWLTVSIREQRAREAARRRDHGEMMGALSMIAAALAGQEGRGDARARSTRAQRQLR